MKKYVECRVCGHGFEITRMENEDGSGWDEDFGRDIDLTIFYPGLKRLSWRERLDSIWRLLRGRQPMGEHVTLELEDAAELGLYLLAISHQDHPRDAVHAGPITTTVTNGSVSYQSGT
jgi:hypothetical protein